MKVSRPAKARQGSTTEPRAPSPAGPSLGEAASRPDTARARWVRVLAVSGLLLLVLSVYGQSLNFPFAPLDDDIYVYENPIVAQGFSPGSLSRAFSLTGDTYFHPLTWLSLQLDAQIFGLDPTGFHLVNTLMHALNVLLFLGLCRTLSGAFWPSVLAAALFAVHPMHVESVVWITERKDVLSIFFWLLAMRAYLRYARAPSAGRYAAVALAMALGLMAKPVLVTLPCALLLLDFWPLARTPWSRVWAGENARSQPWSMSWSRLLLEKLPLLGLGLAATALAVLSHPPLVASGTPHGLGLRLANALVSYCGYLRRLVWPEGLSLHYPFPNQIPAWQTAGAVLVLAGITVAVLRLVRRAPYLLVGWLWFLGVMVPMLKLYSLGLWYSLADRFAYAPFLGLYLALALGWAGLARSRWLPRPVAVALPMTLSVALPVAVVLGLAFLAQVQVGYWRDPVVLLARAVDLEPGSALAKENLATCLLRAGRPENLPRALALARSAMDLNPDSPQAPATAGAILSELNRPGEARTLLEAALARVQETPELRINLGLALYKLNHPLEAVAQYRRALALKPDSPEALVDLGQALLGLGRIAEAVACLQEATRLAPAMPAAWNNLGQALLQAGQPALARKSLERALALAPEDPRINENFGRALQAPGNASPTPPGIRKP